MSTRVTASAMLSATCRQQLREQFGLSLDPEAELGRLGQIMQSGQVGLPTLMEMAVASETSSVLQALAPEEFAALRMTVADGTPLDAPALTTALQAGLAGAVGAARAAITIAARDITANAFAEAGAELGYTVSVCQGDAATGVEMRRDHEVVLVRVHDSGDVELDHAGLFDASCGERQLRLEQGAERRGVRLTRRNQEFHGAASGGELIAAAAATGDASLARATALAATRHGLTPAKRTVTTSPPAEGQRPIRTQRRATT